jgi:hypothetical protein
MDPWDVSVCVCVCVMFGYLASLALDIALALFVMWYVLSLLTCLLVFANESVI